jgi:cytochrome c-type biogenesis protein
LYGLFLALAFGMGRGLPFLLIGVFAGAVVRFTRLGLSRRLVQVLSGLVLLIVSFYYARAFVSLV